MAEIYPCSRKHCDASEWSSTTEIISVGDREADVYDLFVAERPVGVELLIRAAWNRRVVEAPQPGGHERCRADEQPPPCQPSFRHA